MTRTERPGRGTVACVTRNAAADADTVATRLAGVSAVAVDPADGSSVVATVSAADCAVVDGSGLALLDDAAAAATDPFPVPIVVFESDPATINEIRAAYEVAQVAVPGGEAGATLLADSVDRALIESAGDPPAGSPVVDDCLTRTVADEEPKDLVGGDPASVLFRHASDAIAAFRLVEGTPIVEAVNPSFETLFGHEGETVVGENLDDLVVPPDERESAVSHNERVAAGDRVDAEVRRLTADGVRDFLLCVVPLAGESGDDGRRGYAIYTDVSGQKRRVRALDRLHETTREMMAASSADEIVDAAVSACVDVLGLENVGIRLYDEGASALRLVAVTDAAREVLPLEEAIEPGDSIHWSVYESGDPRIIEDVTELEGLDAADAARWNVAAAMYLPLGEYGLLAIGSAAEFAPTDVGLARVLADNTQAALASLDRAATLRERERELRRQNRRLESFASVVSHDLRNPLSVAKGFLELAEESRTEPDANEALDRVAEALDRMDALISDLLTLARQGQPLGEVESVSLERIAGEAWGLVSVTNATLEVEADRTLSADPSRLQTLLENLYRNAVEHGDEDGVVTIRVGATERGFSVADDGIGIPPDEREEVFEWGVTTSETGTGFGLAIVREVAAAHDWEVHLTESEAGGARFEFVVGEATATGSTES